jgi:N utilization substance protein A
MNLLKLRLQICRRKNMELLQVADTVAREKNIDREIVMEAMEEAIQKAGRSKYGYEQDIRARSTARNGMIELQAFPRPFWKTAEIMENEVAQLTVAEAKRIKPDVQPGDFLIDVLPPLDFGRIAAQTAKQVIMQKVREAERARQYEEFKDRVGEIVNGIVKRVEYGNARSTFRAAPKVSCAAMRAIPREAPETGDRVRAIIYEVREEHAARRFSCHAAHPEFMAKLFMQEVPEIYDGIIEIKGVARDPGSRAKIAVASHATAPSTRSALASVCAEAAFRPLSANWAAKKSTSFPGLQISQTSSSAPFSLPP